MDAPVTLTERPDELRHHGGNINAARLRFPDATLPWIDLSTGINPVPYPVGAISPHAWTRLPDPSAQTALEAAARVAYGADPMASVVAAPGTQALLQWLPRLIPARRVGILGFTYGEHEKCWREAGADVVTVGSPGELMAFDAGVVVNPNNPDGRIVPPGVLAATAEALAERGGTLIVDEAFMDVIGGMPGGMPGDVPGDVARGGASLVPLLPRAGAPAGAPAGPIVLRSFGKMYGLAGLRLGFAIGSPLIAAPLRSAMGPWAVSGPAIEIGRLALMDETWRAEAVRRLCEAAGRLDELLRSAGFAIVGGTPLFRLAANRDAAAWFERLARAGILTRPFHAKPGWLRFGLPGAPAEWERLEAVLRPRADAVPAAPSGTHPEQR